MHQLLLSVFLMLPITYDDYVSFAILAEIEGVSIEEYIANEIREKTGCEEISVALPAELNDEPYRMCTYN